MVCVNFQRPFRRTPIGSDTMDAVLDLVGLDGSRRWKDEDELEEWLARGRFTVAELERLRADAAALERDLDAGRRWWSDEWLTWSPDPEWPVPELPTGWDVVPPAPS